jgi:hypothetical protein
MVMCVLPSGDGELGTMSGMGHAIGSGGPCRGLGGEAAHASGRLQVDDDVVVIPGATVDVADEVRLTKASSSLS